MYLNGIEFYTKRLKTKTKTKTAHNRVCPEAKALLRWLVCDKQKCLGVVFPSPAHSDITSCITPVTSAVEKWQDWALPSCSAEPSSPNGFVTLDKRGLPPRVPSNPHITSILSFLSSARVTFPRPRQGSTSV